MKHFILTGAPGAGKTCILWRLELAGHGTVEEAATDVIALAQGQGEPAPWTRPAFIAEVAALQRRRRLRAASMPDKVQFHDRSAICTLALANFVGHRVPPELSTELDAIQAERFFEPRVLFIRTLGFITPTAARTITLEDALSFERLHEETYRSLGYELVPIEPGPIEARVRAVEAVLSDPVSARA